MSDGQNAIPLTEATTIRRTGDWLAAEIGDELVMMNTATNRHIGLTETGKRIWELLATPATLAALCAELGKEYDVGSEELRSDVVEFVQGLVSHGAATLEG